MSDVCQIKKGQALQERDTATIKNTTTESRKEVLSFPSKGSVVMVVPSIARGLGNKSYASSVIFSINSTTFVLALKKNRLRISIAALDP